MRQYVSDFLLPCARWYPRGGPRDPGSVQHVDFAHRSIDSQAAHGPGGEAAPRRWPRGYPPTLKLRFQHLPCLLSASTRHHRCSCHDDRLALQPPAARRCPLAHWLPLAPVGRRPATWWANPYVARLAMVLLRGASPSACASQVCAAIGYRLRTLDTESSAIGPSWACPTCLGPGSVS
jgi:hypothetical protein